MYNLIVTADNSAWRGDPYVLDLSRFGEHTSDDLKKKFVPFSPTTNKKLLSYPTLFAFESPEEMPARIGKIIRAIQRGREIKIEYEFDSSVRPIPPEQIANLSWELGIGDWEMNRTHWAIKHADLIKTLGLPKKTRPQKKRSSLQHDVPVAVESLETSISSQTVRMALADVRVLLQSRGATSALDRVHTALHGYLRQICQDQKIVFEEGESATKLFKIIRTKHPCFTAPGAREKDQQKLLFAIASITDTTGTLRNNTSIAHPNDELLGANESMLVINCVLTVINYLDSKITDWKSR